MSDVLFSIKGFSKSFRSHWTFLPIRAVTDLSLDVYRGESFGFIGHNGAGKTTTIKSVLGLLHPNRGTFFFEGKELNTAEQRKDMGYLPEQPYFYDHLSVRETLEFFGSLAGLKGKDRTYRVKQLLERMSLSSRKNHQVRSLSKGLQQRLGIAGAIINRPKLLFLDEPFSGLDPVGRREIRELIVELNREGTTIFLSSHILSDVQDMCDRVGILAQGRLKEVFALRDLPEMFGKGYTLVAQHTPDTAALLDTFASLAVESELQHSVGERYASFRFNDYNSAARALTEAIAAGVPIHQFQPAAVRLEDVFVKIIEEKKAAKKAGS